MGHRSVGRTSGRADRRAVGRSDGRVSGWAGVRMGRRSASLSPGFHMFKPLRRFCAPTTDGAIVPREAEWGSRGAQQSSKRASDPSIGSWGSPIRAPRGV